MYKEKQTNRSTPFCFGWHALNSGERSIHLRHSIPAEIN